jgi:hypothetical protein
MKLALRIVMAVGATLVALIVAMGIFGMLTPRQHHVMRVASYAQAPDSLWAVIADMEHSPSWRTDILSVKRLPDRHGHAVWLQVTKEGSWPLEIAEESPPNRLVVVVADSSVGFGGTWTYDLSPTGSGTRLSIAEDGFISNPYFRVMARYMFGLSSGIDAYLVALGHRFGETVKPAQVIGV